NWASHFKTCGGTQQSPFPLRFLQSVFKPMEPMHFFNYDSDMTLDVEIMGANLFIFPNASRLAVFGGPLAGEYTFIMGAFHFGLNMSNGAEHKTDETDYAAELQLIHYTETDNPINCLKEVNGLLSLVVLFKEIPENNTELDSFISAVLELQGPARLSSTTRSRFYLSSFMPSTTTDFYLYSGSITFPPCTERVMTVVFERYVEIGKQQLDKLRLLKMRLGSATCQGLIAGNIRKLSEKMGAERTVYRSFRFMPSQ
ncbi:unnamed protein product, partial [Ixodes hexagonus]